ncbi:aldo/keto reductase [Hanamia caeni]|jgi:aryl-alcohol dehydrogenase-like predicted oxidoreductase|uniref:Aldo/keto reductase n=1 Tax=Hanamia caeni TaxID=2294116 RepID=A0A3M9NBF5_9BACT|nr:aldo/keto reductase [Hanamia caeni]RNI34627.1 aldo/keto reductase [Hanamia caeni]
MKIKSLGTQGLTASEMGLGCMGMSDFYGSQNDDESIKTIHSAFDLGITFFDTADMYGPFKNEILVGKAIKPFRNEITLATKFGILRDPVDPKKRGVNGKPEYVKSACEASLKRLDVEVIDLYYLHRKDPATPIEETIGAMGELVKEGKVKAIGVSELNVDTLRKAHATFPITALQSEYSLWSREPEAEILPACNELGIAFVAYSPLGRGFLTGQIKTFEDLEEDDFRRNSPRFMGENFNKNLNLVKKVEAIAKEKNCTPAQLALAWVMAQEDFIFPIPGTKRVKYLEENVKATEIHLSEKDLREIEEVFPENAASGLRYTEAGMKTVDL